MEVFKTNQPDTYIVTTNPQIRPGEGLIVFYPIKGADTALDKLIDRLVLIQMNNSKEKAV